MHGSRSGVQQATAQEYLGTARYAVNEPGGLGWSATVGSDRLAIHMPMNRWGWNARGCSRIYLGVEFAQGLEADPIDDGQVRAFCEFFRQAREAWPNLPLTFPTHAELDGTPAYGGYDGKTDVFRKGSPATNELRGRILVRLAALGIT